MAYGFNLNNLDKRIKKQLDLSLKKAGDLAVNHFKQSFRNGGFTDNTLEAWEPRKSKKDNVGRKILVKSGRLKNSIHATNLNYSNLSLVISTSGVPYAQIHNEGGEIKKGERTFDLGFRKKRGTDAMIFAKIGAKKRKATFVQTVTSSSHDIKMPKRQFIGNSHKLNTKITDMIANRIKLAFK